MAEPVWYYARGDVERGPFTLTQIKALANASKLRPDDLIWKEGMENWTAAREVAELFPPAGLVGDSTATNGSEVTPEPKASTERGNSSRPFDGELRAVFQRIVRVLAWLGIVLVVGTRGCESLSEQRVARLTAVAEIAASENPGRPSVEKQSADRAALDHRAAGFMRAVALYMGLSVLLMGAIGLMMLTDRYERWLGVGLILVVTLAVLTRG